MPIKYSFYPFGFAKLPILGQYVDFSIASFFVMVTFSLSIPHLHSHSKQCSETHQADQDTHCDSHQNSWPLCDPQQDSRPHCDPYQDSRPNLLLNYYNKGTQQSLDQQLVSIAQSQDQIAQVKEEQSCGVIQEEARAIEEGIEAFKIHGPFRTQSCIIGCGQTTQANSQGGLNTLYHVS